MPTALITGATAGIGAAFARRLAVEYHDLVLVARDAERLEANAEELRTAHDIQVEVLPADLSTEDGCAAVVARVADREQPVDVLVNNAGTSLNSSFLETDVDAEERLIAVNIRAVMRLTHAAVPVMVDRRRGDIVNVSSVAGYAGPLMPGSTYPASKAWVTTFSESIAGAVRRHGVRVLALCPGYTRTEFHERAGIDMRSLPDFAWLEADEVVRGGLRDLRRGRTVSVPTVKYKLATAALRHVPRPVLRKVATDQRGRARRNGSA